MNAPVNATASGTARQSVAIIGAGWAGIAAAVAAVQAGHRVSIFETARRPGGRARTVQIGTHRGQPRLLDNGQHILIGAYRQSLQLMREVGVNPAEALLRTPLDLRDADGLGLKLPRLPAPLDGLLGVLLAKGWRWQERLALARQLLAWQRGGFQADAAQTVRQLCRNLPPAIIAGLVEPLCVAAMNTPVEQASAQVFLRILHDSMLGGTGSSNLLIPRAPLGSLLAEPALGWLERQGAQVHTGQRVQQILPAATPATNARWLVDGQPFGAAIIATHSAEAARLLDGVAAPSAPAQASLLAWQQTAAALQHEAIATVYVQVDAAARLLHGRLLPRPMLMLRSGPEHPAQFVFDRQQLGGEAGLLAFVASTSQGSRQQIERQTLQQAAQLLGHEQFAALGTVVEKRATFACTATLARPSPQPLTDDNTLLVCGDYVQGPYPGTLEGAVRNGQRATALLG